jgi:hypothetical protein
MRVLAGVVSSSRRGDQHFGIRLHQDRNRTASIFAARIIVTG